MSQTPPVTKNLIFLNVLCFLAMQLGGRFNIDLNALLGLHFFMAPDFYLYQPVTYMFMHANFTHIFCNMFSLWMFGRIIEQTLGSKRFFWFYILCGIGAAFCQEIVQFVSYYAQGLDHYSMVTMGDGFTLNTSEYLNLWTTIGASGACYGVLVAYGALYPNQRVMLLIPPIPMKAKYMVIGFVLIDLLAGLGASGDNVAHFAHLGGALMGWLLILRIKHRTRQQQGGFTSWEVYEPKKPSLKERLQNWLHRHRSEAETSEESFYEEPQTTSTSAEREDAEIERILDKIKRSGYDSLTSKEKQKLFKS